jgi:hypothetical protein
MIIVLLQKFCDESFQLRLPISSTVHTQAETTEEVYYDMDKYENLSEQER